MANAAEKMADKRQRLRREGLKPLEVWLPEATVDRIDALKKSLGMDSRNKVLLHLIAGLDIEAAAAPPEPETPRT